ncbi:MAG: flagellar biosynthesis protein FlhF [Planctomycetes bacterium]|nr:flagellar biosynthesis protein FlhF [Planctomycetota bacterium]
MNVNLKTYQAYSMAEALAAVKRDLGRDAVILHTRGFHKGGLFGVGGRQMWEITASQNVNVTHRRVGRDRASVRTASPPAVAAKSETTNRVKVVEGPGYLPAAQPQAQPPDAAIAGQDKLVRQVETLTHMVEKLVADNKAGTGKINNPMPEELFEFYVDLLQQEVAEDIAKELVEKVRSQLTGNELQDKALIREKLQQFIASMIPTSLTTIPPSLGRPRVIALIGPTGVGKTTTIAKLAANLKLRQHRRVGLITVDTYRIAAVDQLRTYAQIIQVPLKVVMSPDELTAAIAEMGDCDVILVDTAGRSQHDTDRLWELKQFLSAANTDEVHLVLSTTANQRNIESAMERFGCLGVDRLILTKLDEAVSFGMILNIVRRLDTALSFVTTGQDVPDDIEVSEGRKIAELIVGGSKKC